MKAAHDAIARLARLGPASEILEQGALEAAHAADLDRVVLSRVEAGTLVAERVHLRAGDSARLQAELTGAPVRLAYPLLECELLRRRQARLVTGIDPADAGRYAFAQALAWRAYIAVPVSVDGAVVGFLHGDRAREGQPLEAGDVDALEQYALGFALVFERAALRRRLRDQRREIRRVADWAQARSDDLNADVIDLDTARGADDAPRAAAIEVVTDDGLVAHLTAREVDVLQLMADGKTNGDIARALVVSEGTVKFHVKNILRKMQASNRADASSRYLRLTLRERPRRGTPTHR